MSPAAAIAALALLVLLSWIPGWAIARAARIRTDLFGRLWIGLTLISVIGLVLAESGSFSGRALLVALGVVSVACVLVDWRRPPDPTTVPGGASGWVSWVAATAACATVLWSWPPFETVIAASDSTMYVNAGIHLARTGSLSVADTVARLLPRANAQAIFPSVGLFGVGPFVRLPGGLLMSALDAGRASPAFFPLLPVWAAIVSAIAGAPAVVLVAPFFSALAVGSIVLFAGETLGIAAAAATVPVLIANFAVWWFAKFPMPEPLAAAAIWAGFVFLHRAGINRDRRMALLAGAVLGVAVLARTETVLFLLAAGALAWSWQRLRVPLLPLLLGFASLTGLAAVTIDRSPSHHLAYLHNELLLHYISMYISMLPWLSSRWRVGLVAAGVIGMLALVAAVAVHRSGAGVVRVMFRLVVPLALVAVLIVYVRIGGSVSPGRQLSWLATYCSWPLLVLALIGAPIVWQQGGDAARVAVFAWGVAALVFMLNPRVAPYQPWAIRRFLPVVIPGIVIAASAALVWIATRPRRGAAATAIGVALVVAALELRPILEVRARGYYAGSFALVRSVAERLPEDAIVAIDSDFADVQFQVPLWMIHGRETLMLSMSGQRWRDVMRALVASGRPVVWIGNRYATPMSTEDVTLTALEPDPELTAITPDAPADTPPSRTVRRIIPFRIYGVGLADGVRSEDTSIPLRLAYTSGATTSTTKSTRDLSPLPSVPTTNGP